MIVPEPTDGIHPHAPPSQPRRDDSHEPHGLQARVHVERDHLTREGVLQRPSLRGFERRDDGRALGFLKAEPRLRWWDCGEGSGWGDGDEDVSWRVESRCQA